MQIENIKFTTSYLSKSSIKDVAGLGNAVVIVVRTLNGTTSKYALEIDMLMDSFRDADCKTIVLSQDSPEELDGQQQALGISSAVGSIATSDFKAIHLDPKKKEKAVLYALFNKKFKKVSVNPVRKDFEKLLEDLKTSHKKNVEKKKEITATPQNHKEYKKLLKLQRKEQKLNEKAKKKRLKNKPDTFK